MGFQQCTDNIDCFLFRKPKYNHTLPHILHQGKENI